MSQSWIAGALFIVSYLPKPHADGSPIQPSELPSTLPGYLIRLVPQINLDGQVVAKGSRPIVMGTALQSTGGFTELYDPTQWDLTSEESNLAGNATAIGISAGGISAAQLEQLKSRLTQAQTQLQAQNVSGLSGEQISGDLLTTVIWSWFATSESHNRLSQNQAGIVENPGLSYGLFHASVSPIYSWGVARKVGFPGVNMDIAHVRNLTWAKDSDKSTWVNYNRLRGQYMSGLEGTIPEQFFNDPAKCNPTGTTTPNPNLDNCPRGISAVSAIAISAAAGQKVYTITQAVYNNNPNLVNANLSAHSPNTKDKVQQALDAGYEVTIHEAPISQDGWTGAGYTLIDPSTGAGAYLIDGGSNGGSLLLDILKNAAIAATFFIALATLPIQISLLALGSVVMAAVAGIVGLIAGVSYSLLTGDGVFLAALRFSVMSIAFIALTASACVTAAIGGALALMWAFALAGLYLALALQFTGLPIKNAENGTEYA